MALSPAQRSTIISRGYSSSQLSAWEAENPGDEGRALAAFPVQEHKSDAPAKPTTSSPAPTPAPTPATTALNAAAGASDASGGAAASVGAPALTGLIASAAGGAAASATPSPAAASTQPLGVSGGGSDSASGGVGSLPAVPSQAGQLRQSLGSRIYPQETNALAGLKRAY